MSFFSRVSTTSYQKGIWAEEKAAQELALKGYEVLEKRYKTRYGEIDMIARHADVIVFIEVKIRQDLSEAFYAITPKNRRRVEKAALHYVSQNPDIAEMSMRFDVVALCKGRQGDIKTDGKGGGIWVEHLDNAWELGA